MSKSVSAVDNLFTPAPPFLRRRTPELNGYFIQLQTAAADGTGGQLNCTMQLPPAIVGKWGWKLVHVSQRWIGAGGAATLGIAYQITLPGQASSFRVEWVSKTESFAGLSDDYMAQLNMWVVGRDFPVVFQRPTDLQLSIVGLNINASTLVTTAIYEQYNVEAYKAP